MKPSVGRIVHYTSYGTPDGEYPMACRAAVVADVVSSCDGDGKYVDLCVLNPTGMFFSQGVRYSEDPRGGTWHWPERVE